MTEILQIENDEILPTIEPTLIDSPDPFGSIFTLIFTVFFSAIISVLFCDSLVGREDRSSSSTYVRKGVRIWVWLICCNALDYGYILQFIGIAFFFLI